MRRTVFKSKIHRARVTQADLDYEGSVTIDAALMEAANVAEVPGPERRESPPARDDVHAEQREHLYTRSITCRGHRRSDGLWDIEGQLVDARTYPATVGEGRRVSPGEPIHDLRVKITVDDDYVIRAATAEMQAWPFASCVEASAFYSRLVGLRLASGFAAAVRERFGGPAGCSHLNELLSPMATAAFQTIAGARRDRGGPPSPDELGALLNSCHTLREGGEVDRQVRRALRDHEAGRATGPSDALAELGVKRLPA